MDTVESRIEEQPSAETVYDGFISYSHAADDLLAPRLQAGLQRFAKPWWKRRALRIFRDETSLSANPHLWSSITDALDQSGWFVLLLSPEAAESPWVNNEVEYWLEHKDPDRIIPVLTDGEFGWANDDVGGDAVPAALRGAFSDEPRWVDLRFVRTDEQLDLKNPQFSAAIADVASAIRGVPKEELASEEVRQHRRTRRTAVGAGVALLILAVATGVFGVVALNNAQDAQVARAEAQTERDDAVAARDEAESERAAAESARALAEARELAASSIGVVAQDPELATLLAVESIDQGPAGAGLFPEGLISLRKALDANRLVDRMVLEEGNDAFVEWTGDGSSLIISSGGGVIARYDVTDGKIVTPPVWVYGEDAEFAGFSEIAVHPVSPTAAVTRVTFGGTSGEVGRVFLIDLTTGRAIRGIPLGECVEPVGFGFFTAYSSDGSLLRVDLGATDCAVDPTWFGSVLYDTTTWQEVHRFDRAWVSLTADLTRVLMDREDGTVELLSYPDLELISTHDVNVGDGWTTISPDGTTIVLRYENGIDLRPGFWDIESDRLLSKGDAWEGFFVGRPQFTSDGRTFVVSTESDVLYDPRTGQKLLEIPTAWTLNAAISPDDRLVATSARGGTIELWEIGESGTGRGLSTGEDGVSWFNSDIIEEGVHTAVWGFPDFSIAWFGGWLLLLDPATGEILEQRAHVDAAQLPDGRFVIVPSELIEGGTIGPLSIWNPADGSEIALQDCQPSQAEYFPEERWDPLGSICPDGDLFFGGSPAVSADGRYIAQFAFDPSDAPIDPAATRLDPVVRIWNAETLEEVRTFDLPLERGLGNNAFGPYGDGWLLVIDGLAGGQPEVTYRVIDTDSGERIAELDQAGAWRETREINGDYSRLYTVEESGLVWEYDTLTWEPVRSWQAMEGRPRGMALSPDERLLAVSGEDELIAIWQIDVDDPVLVDRIPIGAWPSDIMWIDDERMGVAIVHSFGRTEWRVVTLNPAAVVAAARQSLVRDFTPDECGTYQIERCLESVGP